ncbi:MAG: hypothetical protein AAFS02_10910 [Pseudomonadota bacterium]
MRIIIGFILGFIPGALAAVLLMLHNPMFDGDAPRVASGDGLELAVHGQDAVNVVRTSSGYPWIPAEPASVVSPNVEGMRSAVRVVLASTATAGEDDTADGVAYIARVSTLTREGRPLFGELIEQSMWHVVVPGGGSFFVVGEDDLWGFVRRMVLPMARGNDFRGKVAFETTIGPVRGGGRVIGLSGEFEGLKGSSELSQMVRRASLGEGVTDAESTLHVSF